MLAPPDSGERFCEWVAALDRRHLSELTPSEVAKALRALSTWYVERRERLPTGVALGTPGKRAAFALFYGPVHFLITRHIVRALGDQLRDIRRITDLGCGTGAAGAAWALEAAVRVTGIDRHPWAVAEANWTYHQLGVRGRAARGDIARTTLRAERGTGVIAAYTLNELPEDARERLLAQFIDARDRGAHVLIVEPIARRMSVWWQGWTGRLATADGRSDEWRFPLDLPPRQRDLARAAGLDPRELTAKSLLLPPE